MINLKKKIAVLAAAGMLAVVSFTGCGRVNDAAVVGKIGEEKITLGVANFYARRQQAQYETYYAPMMGTTGEQMWRQKADENNTFEDMSKEEMLEALKNLYVIRQHSGEYDVELTDEELKAIDEAAAGFVRANEEESIEVISGSEDNIKEVLKLMTIQFKMDEPMKAGADTEVSDDEAAQKSMEYATLSFTKTNDDGTKENVSDDDKAKMRDALQDMIDRVKSGDAKDLKEAGEYVKTASSLPFEINVRTTSFDSESTMPDKDIVKAVDALAKEGDLTELIENESGVSAARLVSLLDREATDAKKNTIVSERKNTAYKELLDKWKEETEIDMNEKVWKKIDFIKQGVGIKQKPKETEEEK